MDQIAKGLNRADHPRHRFGLIGRRGIDLPHHLPGRSTQLTQESALKSKINPQPLGNRENELPMWHRRAHLLAHPERRLQRPFLMAAGTQTTAPAGIGHEKLMRTIRATHPGKTLLQVAAFQELFDGRGDAQSPKAVAFLGSQRTERCRCLNRSSIMMKRIGLEVVLPEETGGGQ